MLNSLETNMSKSVSYMSAKHTYYDMEYNEKLFEAIDRMTPDDIRMAANYVFQNPPVTSIVASQKTLDALNLK